ncbi:hemerythrin domain-containing protein [Vibrio sp. S4M6]|uniref:hemerythrin domain-containing protein n=1 Tax=Vibrio sinus TaxID=2946865 RepID=UPI00202A6900|nr:hemerythrin domain-containing protein [Vibrio sinus]MCL9783072.1 hemerythrin domain-containing protein [Vibrio sinus]
MNEAKQYEQTSARENLDVLTRKQLPASIERQLIQIPRDTWSQHPNYFGKAKFFIDYHNSLKQMSAALVNNLEVMLDSPKPDFTLQEVIHQGQGFIQTAHHHHYMEDHFYFPHFRRVERELGKGIDLLDGDHKSLSNALNDVQERISFPNGQVDPNFSLGYLHERAVKLDNILKRHLDDEEEIIIPIFLKYERSY